MIYDDPIFQVFVGYGLTADIVIIQLRMSPQHPMKKIPQARKKIK
jgi:hypothetical protein